MPEKCPLRHPNSSDERVVRLYHSGVRKLLVHEDAVEWAIRYLADEFATGGVAVIPRSAPTVLHQDCEGVPGLRVKWDFTIGQEGWVGWFATGPAKSAHLRASVNDLSVWKWNRVADESWSDFHCAPYALRKEAMKRWIILQCMSKYNELHESGGL